MLGQRTEALFEITQTSTGTASDFAGSFLITHEKRPYKTSTLVILAIKRGKQ